MANYIKIPLAINPARSFNVGALNGTATGGGTVADGGGGASAAQPILGGSGSGATATVTKGGSAAIGDATITISNIGEGYKAGDEVTIAAYALGGATTWTAIINYTILAKDLVTSSGSSTNEYKMIPIDNVMGVQLASATSALIETNQWDAGAGAVLKWTVTMDDVPATTAEHLAGDLATAINKASQAENSQPTVEFLYDAECLSAVLS